MMQNGGTRVFHGKILCKLSRNVVFLQVNEKFCVITFWEKQILSTVHQRWFQRGWAIGWRFLYMNCKFSYLIIHVLPLPTRAERFRSELIVLYNGNFCFVLSSLFRSLNKFVTIDSMICSRETRQGQLVQDLYSEEEFAAHQSLDLASNHDGGWCEFVTACEGNYQYLLLWKVVPP